MRMVTTAVVIAMILGGCGSARHMMFYDKPGVSEEQMRADESACTRAALNNAGQRGAAFLSVDEDTVIECMRARGYRLSTGRSGYGSVHELPTSKIVCIRTPLVLKPHAVGPPNVFGGDRDRVPSRILVLVELNRPTNRTSMAPGLRRSAI